MEDIIQIFVEKYWKAIKKKKNVTGYSGTLLPRIKNGKVVPGTKCVRIYVREKVPVEKLESKDLIPRTLEIGSSGIETDIVELPEIRYLDECPECSTVLHSSANDHRKKYRPAPAGVSCTHEKSTACTLGWFFKRKARISSLGHEINEILIGLNNHCGGLNDKAKPGDLWLQPSPYDGGSSNDRIATYVYNVPTKYNSYKCPFRRALTKLYRLFYRLVHFRQYDVANRVDIAFGKPCSLDDIDFSIYGIDGKIVGKGEHKLNTIIMKSGRSSGVSSGPIFDPSWNGYVSGSRGVAWYEDCVLVKAKCTGGDSGSPCVSKNSGKPGTYLFHGLLFAGSSQNDLIYCKWENIEKEGNVETITE
jgi:hypothetical protein